MKGRATLEIRQATSRDLTLLAGFARLTYTAAYGDDLGSTRLHTHITTHMRDEDFARMLQFDKFFLAFLGSRLVGFSQLGRVNPEYAGYIDPFDAEASELRRLYVEPDLQGEGIGSGLLRTVLRDPLVLQGHTIYLTTWCENTGAQRLYQRHGFSKAGEIPEYGDDGALNGHEYIMTRPVHCDD